ncbi:MAG: type II toxin-antitoxin system HicA family toxin [Alphaproteobacteria bacterium]
MTHDEFKRWLAKQGARFEEGKRHTKVFLGGRASVLPRHGRKEIPAGTVNAIKHQLGIKEDR